MDGLTQINLTVQNVKLFPYVKTSRHEGQESRERLLISDSAALSRDEVSKVHIGKVREKALSVSAKRKILLTIEPF
jgi:hypothetical protein